MSPEEVARALGTSSWWVREQARLGRVPHLRLGRRRIRFLPEHLDVLVKVFTVLTVDDSVAQPPVASEAVPRLSALGATSRSVACHERKPANGGHAIPLSPSPGQVRH